ncbi:hypothetical protein SBDP1_90085 [Syntrophobacter sp. SbD1]|nr:hypothetical protein SBDP1_90085 [Syntrophobacter sp. SbD1]
MTIKSSPAQNSLYTFVTDMLSMQGDLAVSPENGWNSLAKSRIILVMSYVRTQPELNGYGTLKRK